MMGHSFKEAKDDMDQRKREKERKKNRREAHRAKNTTMVVDNEFHSPLPSSVWNGVVDAIDLFSVREEKKEEEIKRNDKVSQLRLQLRQIREKMSGMDKSSSRYDALARAELSTYKSLVRNLEVLKHG